MTARLNVRPYIDDRPDWFDAAACHGLNPNLFFPEPGEDSRAARAICATCPVRRPCAERGQREVSGAWGGVTHRSDWNRGPRPLPPINHGTYGGYQAHRRRGEEPCAECTEAHARYKTARQQERAAS